MIFALVAKPILIRYWELHTGRVILQDRNNIYYLTCTVIGNFPQWHQLRRKGCWCDCVIEVNPKWAMLCYMAERRSGTK